MNWKLVYLPEAEKDFKELSGNERIVVAKALKKVLEKPLPVSEGGYGKPLGNKQGNNLSGILKIKFGKLGGHGLVILGAFFIFFFVFKLIHF